MSSVVTDAPFRQGLRKEILVRIDESPDVYLHIGETYQSDPEICLATLSACNYNDVDTVFPKILDIIKRHMPDFDDHKAAFLRFVQGSSKDGFIKRYMHHFRPEIEQDRAFLKDALERDSFADFFKRLSLPLRMDVELLKIPLENIHESRLHIFISHVPPVALEEHEFIFLRALERGAVRVSSLVPSSFWQSRDFLLQCTAKKGYVSINSVPETFRNDREICLALYRSQPYYDLGAIIHWIPNHFLTDKDFVLECLRHHPKIYHSCEKNLKNDFDVFVVAAVAAIQVRLLHTILDNKGEPSVLRVNAIRTKLEAHDEFMTFLACSWKSRRFSLLPLNALDCDNETARGLNATVAGYLGFSGTNQLECLKQVWDEIMFLAVEGRSDFSTYFIPLMPPQALMLGVLKAIACNRTVSLRTYPDKLWSYRLFVNWAAKRGMMHKAISNEFAADPEICLAYYKHSTASRRTILPWISESLKSDQGFVVECLSFDLIILQYCKKDLLFVFEVLLEAAYYAMENDDFDGLVRTVIKEGWEDAFVIFAKFLRAKLEICKAVRSFEKQAEVRFFRRAPAAKTLIGSYLGIDLNAPMQYRTLKFVWSNNFFFCLALGGSVEEIYKSCKLWSKQEREARADSDEQSDDDSDYDSDYDSDGE
jgi:hypothetical protein